MAIVPAFGSASATVSGKRSARSPRRPMTDRQGNALGPICAPHDDELSGLANLRHARCLDIEARDIGTKLYFGDDAMHGKMEGEAKNVLASPATKKAA